MRTAVVTVLVAALGVGSARAAPDRAEAQHIYERAASLHRAGKPGAAIPGYLEAQKLGLNNPALHYNLACAYAVTGAREPALAALETLAQRGYDDAAALEKDSDLVSLRGEPRFAAVLRTVRTNKAPCRGSPEFRQLDFWIGDWDVLDPTGKKIGQSHVEPLLGDCVVLENWTDARGRQGKSFNIYDATARKWRQVWVDDFGGLHDYSGGFENGAMRFTASFVGRDGKPRQVKLTFTPLAGGRVRQTFENSLDGGKTWAPSFDGTYVPRK